MSMNRDEREEFSRYHSVIDFHTLDNLSEMFFFNVSKNFIVFETFHSTVKYLSRSMHQAPEYE